MIPEEKAAATWALLWVAIFKPGPTVLRSPERKPPVAKLYFRHGPMNAAKTLNLLAVRHNYLSQGKRVLVIKSRVDDRWGPGERVLSRAGIDAEADLLLGPEDLLLDLTRFRGYHCILVDEAQFLTPEQVNGLREVALLGVPVICYGLRTDFQTNLFPGSRRLLELADSIEEVKTTCQFCNRKAIFNLRHDSRGIAILEGPQVQVGAEEAYSPTCAACYAEKIDEARHDLHQGA